MKQGNTSINVRFFDSEFRRIFTVLTFCLQNYLYLLAAIIVLIQRYWPRQFSLRESLSAQRDFGEPSSLVVPASLLSALIVYFIINYLRTSLDKQVRESLIVRIFPAQIFSSFIFLKYLLLGEWGQFLSFDKNDLIEQVIQGSILTFAFIHTASILISILITVSLKNKFDVNFSPNSFWLVPPLMLSVYSTFYFQKVPGVLLLLIWISASFSIFLLYLLAVLHKIRFLRLVILISLAFPLIAVRSPHYLLTWRPEFVLIEIQQTRILIFILGFVAILGALAFGFARRNINLMELPFVLAMWAVISTPIYKTLLTPLDNYHFGEMVSPWYNANASKLSLYKDIELPRGILVNYIPAEITNFLGGLNPEIFHFYYILEWFAFAFFLGLLWSKRLPLALLVPIVLILPQSSASVDTFLVSCLILTALIIHFQNIGSLNIIIPLLPLIFIIWISLMPGHGILFGLVVIVIIFQKDRINFLRNIFAFSLSLVLTIILLTLSGLKSWIPAIEWVIQNAKFNNVMFGDEWVSIVIQGEPFPLNLRFFALLIPIFSCFLYLQSRNKDQFLTKSLLISVVCISLLSSSRWYGRMDNLSLSRIGLEILILLLLVLVPAIYFQEGRSHRFALVLVIGFATLLSYGPNGVPDRFELSNFRETTITSKNMSAYFPEHALRGTLLSNLDSTINSLEINSPVIANMTGGSAIDFYLGRPSVGGVTSPFQIVSDRQELKWLNNLKRLEPHILIGGYGDLGSAAFDSSSFSGRASTVFSWIMLNYQPLKCEGFFLMVKKNIPFKVPSNCTSPKTGGEELDFWNRISNVVPDKQDSLLSWGKMALSPRYDLVDQKNIRFNPGEVNRGLSIGLLCTGIPITGFVLDTQQGEEILRFNFSAATQTGKIGFNPYIFPIANMSTGVMNLRIISNSCIFI